MIDTNSIPAAGAAAQAESLLTATNIVLLGAGALVMHLYHVVVKGGGLRTIWKNFMGPKT